MQNNKNYSEILDLVTTKEDLLTLNQELELIEQSIYEVKSGNFEDTMKKIRINTSSLIQKFTLNEDKERVVKEIKEELEKIKFLEITLSDYPNQELLGKIFAWLKKTVDQKIALDIKIDPLIIGGATFSYQGKFFDGSLSSKLQTILKNYGQ